MSWQPRAPRGVQLNKAAVVSRLLQTHRPQRETERGNTRRHYDSSSSSSSDGEERDRDRVSESESDRARTHRGAETHTEGQRHTLPDLHELRLEANGGSTAAQAALGTLLWAEDQPAALGYLTAAANQGHAASSYRLGAVSQASGDLPSAAVHFEAAADGGHAEAQLRLGEMLESGEGVPRDTARAMNYYRAAMADTEKQTQRDRHTEHAAANNLGELLVAEAVRRQAREGSASSHEAVPSSPEWAEAQRLFERSASAGALFSVCLSVCL